MKYVAHLLLLNFILIYFNIVKSTPPEGVNLTSYSQDETKNGEELRGDTTETPASSTENKTHGSFDYQLSARCMSDNGACLFPFTYDGNSFNGCIGPPNQRWCATRRDRRGRWWGYCRATCPLHSDAGVQTTTCRPDTWSRTCSMFTWACTDARYPWFKDVCATTCNNCGGGGTSEWGEWEQWSRCSSSCGPGTQTRRRTCSGSNCSGSDEEESECTVNPRRRRKNVATLTSTERQRLQRALREAIARETPWRNYQDNANLHGAPSTVCRGKTWGICCPHGNTDFLAWHRLLMVNTEQMLNEAVPYWDWTESSAVPDLWENIRGPMKSPHTSSGRDCLGTDITGHRRARTIQIDLELLKRETKLALEDTSFQRFSNQFEIPHNILHTSMGCDMPDTFSAAYDPIFYLHHSYVDYIFAYWQELQRLRGLPVEMRLIDQRMEPFNSDIFNPYDITRNNRRVGDIIDYQNTFCYEYDNLIFDGMTPQQFLDQSGEGSIDQSIRRQGEQNRKFRVFVGVAMPKVAPTVLVKFDVCNKENKCVKGGTLATFGPSPSEVRGRDLIKRGDISTNYNMIEYEVTHIGVFKKDDTFGAGRSETVFDISATARITSTDDLGIMSGVEPIMIWRHVHQGVGGGTAYLQRGAKREDYGTLLNEYDTVIEN